MKTHEDKRPRLVRDGACSNEARMDLSFSDFLV
jgi:hypothetical protein